MNKLIKISMLRCNNPAFRWISNIHKTRHSAFTGDRISTIEIICPRIFSGKNRSQTEHGKIAWSDNLRQNTRSKVETQTHIESLRDTAGEALLRCRRRSNRPGNSQAPGPPCR